MEKLEIMMLDDTIKRIKVLRNELKRERHIIITGENLDLTSNIIKEAESIGCKTEECNLDRLNVDDDLTSLDDLEGLMFEYGVHVPEDHDSPEFNEWYESEYYRIGEELDRIITKIDEYLDEL